MHCGPFFVALIAAAVAVIPFVSCKKEVFDDQEDYVTISFTVAGDALCVNISDFEWDKAYKMVADYMIDTEIRTVIYINTFDRNRESVILPLQEYTFTLNYFDESTGFGYKKDLLGLAKYYYWKSESIGGAVKTAF